MGLSLSWDIGWDCQWECLLQREVIQDKGLSQVVCDMLGISTMLATKCAWRLLAGLPMPARGHRCNLSSFPCHSSDQLCWYPSLGLPKEAVLFLPHLVPMSSSSSGVWPLTEMDFSLVCIFNQHFLLSLPLFCLKNPNRLMLLPLFYDFTVIAGFRFVLQLCGLP